MLPYQVQSFIMNLNYIIPVFLGNFRGWEWLVIFLVVLLLFGGKKIPELMRGLGKGIHSFRKGMEEAKQELTRPLDEDDAKQPAKEASKE